MTMTPAMVPLERLRLFTALGVRFWDGALDAPVADLLDVRAWPQDAGAAPVQAVRGPSGVYAFHGLPGLRRTERPDPLDETPEEAPEQVAFTLEVRDPRGWYQPIAFSVMLPLGYRGELGSASPGSPPGAGGRCYLFSAPARPLPGGTAAIRADLLDADTGGPAAWAVLQVEVEGREAEAMAGPDGRVLLPVPIPTVDRLNLGSPPGSGQGSPLEHAWPVTARVRYQPASLRFPLAGTASASARVPGLRSVLEDQGDATIVAQAGSAPVPELVRSLPFGGELVLRTLAADGTAATTMWVHAAP